MVEFTNAAYETDIQEEKKAATRIVSVPDTTEQPTKQVSSYRWVILSLYCSFMIISGFTTLLMYSIANITKKFYDIHDYQLTWSSNALFMIQMAFLLFSGLYAARYGLRQTMLVGSAMLSLSLIFVFFSVYRHSFALFILGVATGSLGYILVQPLCSLVSTVWFAENEQAMAINLAISFSPCLGSSLAFVMPITVFKDIKADNDMAFVKSQLQLIVGSLACCALLTFVLVLIYYADRPTFDETSSDAAQEPIDNPTFKEIISDLKVLLKSFNYHLAAHASSLPLAALQTMGITTNQLLFWKFATQEYIIGWFGCTSLWTSAIGSLIISKLADRKGQYKLYTIIPEVIALGSWLAFALMLFTGKGGLVPLILAMNIATFFAGPCCGTVIEMIMIITHPISPSTAVSPVFLLSNFWSMCFVFIVGWLFEQQDHFTSLWLVAGMLGLSLLLVFLTKTAPNQLVQSDVDNNDERGVSNKALEASNTHL